MSASWVAVASADHVRHGRQHGFMQVCHGKAAPLRRIHPGDRVAYYSPCTAFRGKDKLQSFTAIGTVQAGEPYAFDMGGGFRPFRRNVVWFEASETPIRPLLDRLEFSAGVSNWGYQLRFGLFAISGADMDVISSAMQPLAQPHRGGIWPTPVRGNGVSETSVARVDHMQVGQAI